MPRKSKSTFEDLIEIAAILPPWIGVVSALISYLIFHANASLETVIKTLPSGMTTVDFGAQLFGMFSYYAQYIFPIALLTGSFISFIRRRQGKSLAARIKQAGSDVQKELNEMSWREFELLVTTLLRSSGFSVSDNFLAGADGGKDQVLRKDGKTYLVQCKHWKARSVGVSVVREMFGLMVAEGADEVWIVTSGSFTNEAIGFADNKPIRLFDGSKLQRLEKSSNWRSCEEPQPTKSDERPMCPRCDASMVLRTARKGVNAGKKFWGCSKYPGCRGTLSN